MTLLPDGPTNRVASNRKHADLTVASPGFGSNGTRPHVTSSTGNTIYGETGEFA